MMAAKFDKKPPPVPQKPGFNFKIIVELAVAAGTVGIVLLVGLLGY